MIKIADILKPEKYIIIIHFDHNDENPDETIHNDEDSTFDYNLKSYCNEARYLRGISILINWAIRKNFEKAGVNIGADETLRNTTYTKGAKVGGSNILIDKLWDYRLALINAEKK